MSFLRYRKKRCFGCGTVLPKTHATVQVRHADGVSHLLVCEDCERVMEAVHEQRVESDRGHPVDEG